MDIWSHLLASLLLLALGWREAYSLICHVCNSSPYLQGAACLDPFLNTTFLQDCSSFNPKAKACRKITQSVEGDYRVIRQCSNVEAPLGCLERAASKYVRVRQCHCDHSYCNSANLVTPNTNLGPTVLLLVASFYHTFCLNQ